MMRSLWSGVSGLQAHQIAMDVEGNNIANVNTTGFKYSRANFADLMYQTSRIATAPQGELGGTNSMQIGLGTQVNTVTKIFKQGSVQTTDKQTDLAIQGDGFFVVSPDGGNTLKYTRDGNFNFDAQGNFVTSTGYIVQGWVRDETTGIIDSTMPIGNITIPPGLTTPANPTSVIALKANLNSGDTITNKSPIYSLDSTVTNTTGVDMGVVFNASGQALNVREGQGMWMSYADAVTQPMNIIAATGNQVNFQITLNGTIITGTLSNPIAGGTDAENNAQTANEIAQLINQQSNITGVVAVVQNNNQLVLKNNNNTGTESSSKNINLVLPEANQITGMVNTTVITAYQYTYSASAVPNPNNTYNADAARNFNTTEDLRIAMQNDARYYTNYAGSVINDTITWNNPAVQEANKNDGVSITVGAEGNFIIQNPSGDAPEWYFNNVSSTTLNSILAKQDVVFPVGTVISQALTLPATYVGPLVIIGTNAAGVKETLTLTGGDVIPAGFIFTDQEVNLPEGSTFQSNTTNVIPVVNPATFETTINFGNATGISADTYYSVTINGVTVSINGATTSGQIAELLADAIDVEFGGALTTTWNNAGVLTIDNFPQSPTITVSDTSIGANVGTSGIEDAFGDGGIHDHAMYLRATGLTNVANNVSENTKLLNVFSALEGILNPGFGQRNTQNLYVGSQAASIDVIDSLGSKHTVRIEFRKSSITDDGGVEWSIKISVPGSGKINFTGIGPDTEVEGSIKFNNDGSLATYNPSSISYTANNGSSPNQTINLNFGTSGQFNGVTSFDKTSATTSISQDGYTGGDLNGIAIDETGTLIGSFTNGRSFGLGQISMATFTNNEGLNSEGGNIFSQTANSGDPTIGSASTGGRGNVQASSLEMSNVDLSRSLTQLIVIQRGYQANSKTITTSDTMLETLIGLKR